MNVSSHASTTRWRDTILGKNIRPSPLRVNDRRRHAQAERTSEKKRNKNMWKFKHQHARGASAMAQSSSPKGHYNRIACNRHAKSAAMLTVFRRLIPRWWHTRWSVSAANQWHKEPEGGENRNCGYFASPRSPVTSLMQFRSILTQKTKFFRLLILHESTAQWRWVQMCPVLHFYCVDVYVGDDQCSRPSFKVSKGNPS